MNEVPDWLWQGIATNLLADGLVAAGWLAWKYRAKIIDTLDLTPEDIVVSMQPATLRAKGQPILLSAVSAGRSSSSATGTLTVVCQHSLARRLGELASWYLHVS